MKVNIIMVLVWCLGLSMPASAEFYQFTDEKGVVRFTDNIVEVPAAQRQTVKRFAEPDDHLTPEQLAERERLKKEAEAAPSEPATLRQKEAVALNAKKTELDQATAALLKERQALQQEGKRILANDVSQYEAYRQKVSNFNLRLSEHQKELSLFNEKAQAFNKAGGEVNPAR